MTWTELVFFFKKKNKKRTLAKFGKVLLLYILEILNIFYTHIKREKKILKKLTVVYI